VPVATVQTLRSLACSQRENQATRYRKGMKASVSSRDDQELLRSLAREEAIQVGESHRPLFIRLPDEGMPYDLEERAALIRKLRDEAYAAQETG
jgi:hypothetical protein